MKLQNRKRLTDFENKLMVARGEYGGKGTVREFGIDTYTQQYLKWITIKDLLYGSYTQYSVITYKAKESGKKYICTYK